jgi:hypothetical protein
MMRPRFPVAIRGVALLGLCGPVLAGCIFGFRLLPYTPPSRSPAPSFSAVSPSPGPTAQPLPLVPGESLPGAPAAAVGSLAEDGSIRISAWQSGRPLRTILEVPRLNPIRGLENILVSTAPTAKLFAISEMVESVNPFADDVRVFSAAGKLVWTRHLENQRATIRWSPDGSRLAIDGGRKWLVVTFTNERSPTVQEIVTARPPLSDGRVIYPWILIDFSEDGRWLYGAEQTPGTPGFRVAMRVAASGGRVQPIRGLPTTRGARLAFPPMFGGPRYEPAIDRASGSIVTAACGLSDACRLNVWRDRTAFFFDLPLGSRTLDVAWLGGSLICLWRQESAQGPALHLSRFDAASRPGTERRITSLPPYSSGGTLVGLTSGFVLVGIGSGVPNAKMELVLIRLSDGARSVVNSVPDSPIVEPFSFAGWLPAGH